MAAPAYTRLNVDERRRQLIEAGTALFAEHAYEEISMAQIARTAGVSKPLLYHYFPSKLDLFKAAMADYAAELAALIAPAGEASAAEQLALSLEAYLGWIDAHARTWTKLMQSAASIPEGREIVEGFRGETMNLLLAGLSTQHPPRPALRTAIQGWLGYLDAAILDWATHRDLPRDALRDILLTTFGGALMAARQVDPELQIELA